MIAADVVASNGVIHVIDQVLIPKGAQSRTSSNTIVNVARATDTTSTLVVAAQAANAGAWFGVHTVLFLLSLCIGVCADCQGW